MSAVLPYLQRTIPKDLIPRLHILRIRTIADLGLMTREQLNTIQENVSASQWTVALQRYHHEQVQGKQALRKFVCSQKLLKSSFVNEIYKKLSGLSGL